MTAERRSIPWPERYRMVREACETRVASEIALAAANVCDPVAKLKLLREVINHEHALPRTVKYGVVKPLVRTWLQGKVLALVGLLFTATVFAAYNYRSQNKTSTIAGVASTASPAVKRAPTNGAEIKSTQDDLQPLPESLPSDVLGVTPTTIWLADHGVNWEVYSNGLRVETLYTVAGEARRYRVHDKDRGLQNPVHTKPVGILFHTSESDVWPLDTGFEKQLRQSSAALLSYVQQQRAYNYVIDRFGRVYRVVEDETRANHAGYSVWANGNDVYLDLNAAFLGVSFESRWEGGRTLPITRAQLIAGRNLTNYLRQRFAIAPEMCVTHGLTSVSAKQHLIGYHLDWARGFPFAAFGLPDQYALPPPSMVLFGFTYNDEFVRTVGDGWPGALAAEAVFAREALDRGVDVETLRAERHALFGKWLNEARSFSNDSSSSATARVEPATLSIHKRG
jgi:hypothetical protein